MPTPPADPPAPDPATLPAPAPDPAGTLVRWAAFSCALVPLVLLGYGTPPGSTATATLGLAAVTAVCRLLLRRSGPASAHAPAGRSAPGVPAPRHRGGGSAGRTAAGAAGPRRGRHSRTGPGAHRGSRRGGVRPPGD